MKKLKITSNLLRNWDACTSGLRDFEETYPNGVTISDDQEWNFEKLQDSPILGDANWFAETVLVNAVEGTYVEGVCKCSPGCTTPVRVYPGSGPGVEYFLCGLLADVAGVLLSRRNR